MPFVIRASCQHQRHLTGDFFLVSFICVRYYLLPAWRSLEPECASYPDGPHTMIPLVTCPYCTRMIKLRRRNCNRDFVHAECGATIHVPKIGELRNGLSLSLVAAPGNSFEEAVAQLPKYNQIEPTIAPRELCDPRRPDPATSSVHSSLADLADLAAKLQELTAGLAEVAAKLQEITGTNPITDDAARNDTHPLASEQAAHAVLVKGKADRATLKETYRPMEDVHELREDNEEALALKEKRRERARERARDRILSKAAPWEMDEADSSPAGRSRNATFPWKIVIPSAAVLFTGGFSAAILSRSDKTEDSPSTPSYQEVLSKIDAAPGGAEKIALIHSNIDTIKQGVNKPPSAHFSTTTSQRKPGRTGCSLFASPIASSYSWSATTQTTH